MKALLLLIALLAGACSTPSINYRGDKRSNNFAIDESFIKFTDSKLQKLAGEKNGLASCHLGDERKGLKELASNFSVNYNAHYLNKLGTCHLLKNDLNRAMF